MFLHSSLQVPMDAPIAACCSSSPSSSWEPWCEPLRGIAFLSCYSSGMPRLYTPGDATCGVAQWRTPEVTVYRGITTASPHNQKYACHEQRFLLLDLAASKRFTRCPARHKPIDSNSSLVNAFRPVRSQTGRTGQPSPGLSLALTPRQLYFPPPPSTFTCCNLHFSCRPLGIRKATSQHTTCRSPQESNYSKPSPFAEVRGKGDLGRVTDPWRRDSMLRDAHAASAGGFGLRYVDFLQIFKELSVCR